MSVCGESEELAINIDSTDADAQILHAAFYGLVPEKPRQQHSLFTCAHDVLDACWWRMFRRFCRERIPVTDQTRLAACIARAPDLSLACYRSLGGLKVREREHPSPTVAVLEFAEILTVTHKQGRVIKISSPGMMWWLSSSLRVSRHLFLNLWRSREKYRPEGV